jgi:L-amino acid N-acyltransferase YncA
MSDRWFASNKGAADPEVDSGRAEVRPAMETDMEAVLRIYVPDVRNGTGSFEEQPPAIAELASRRAALVERGLPFLVAEAPRGILGFASAAPFRPRSAYRFTVEDSVYVHPDAVGLGIGRLLLSDLIARCAALKYQQMWRSSATRPIIVRLACTVRSASDMPARSHRSVTSSIAFSTSSLCSAAYARFPEGRTLGKKRAVRDGPSFGRKRPRSTGNPHRVRRVLHRTTQR